MLNINIGLLFSNFEEYSTQFDNILVRYLTNSTHNTA